MGECSVSAFLGHGEGPSLGLSYDCDSATGWEARGTRARFLPGFFIFQKIFFRATKSVVGHGV
jgi:hypothetical protein